MFGNVRVNLNKDENKDEFAWVISVCLRHKFICNNVLNNHESLYILENSSQKILSLQIPDMEFIALNSYKKIVQSYFFHNTYLLHGLSLCDIGI